MARTTPRNPTRTPARQATRLLEWAAAAPSGSPLTVDRERRVIEGVSVLGRYSRNSHGCPGAANGTEYSPGCQDDAIARGLYEGAEVLANHDTLGGNVSGLKTRQTPRGVEYVVGVLRNPRRDGDRIRADLHYFESHPMSARVLEDVERGLGVLGLSHDARAEKEHVDRAAGRLVIDRLACVNSVDLVRKPATNRNLWESRAVPKTVREMLEGLGLKLGPKWKRRLFEDDALAPAMDAPMPEADAGAEGDLKAGLMAALAPLLDDAFESGDSGKAVAALRDFVKLHSKHTGGEAPSDEDLAEGDETGGGDDKKKSDEDKTEAVKELAELKAEKAGRKLCESLGHAAPTEVQLKALAGLTTDAERRQLVESFKAAAKAGRPTSSGPASRPTAAPATAKDFASSIKD